MIFVGVDQSLEASGVAILEVGRGAIETVAWSTTTVRGPSKAARARSGLGPLEVEAARLASIAKGIAEVVPHEALVVIEGIAYGATDTDRKLAALRWFVIDALRRRGCRVREVPPSQRASYATATHVDEYRAATVKAEDGTKTAKSRAKNESRRRRKAVVVEAIGVQHPDAEVEDDNVADAVALAALGARMAGYPVERVEGAAHSRIAKSLAWRWE